MDEDGHVFKKRDLRAKARRMPDSLSDFYELGIVDLLENDERPTFLLDIGARGSFDGSDAPLVYFNDSLKSTSDVLEQIKLLYSPVDGIHDLPSKAFRKWTLRTPKAVDTHLTRSRSACKLFLQFIWTTVTVRGRWILVSGIPIAIMDDLQNDDSDTIVPASTTLDGIHGDAQNFDFQGTAGKRLDWTLPGSCFETNSHIKWVRDFDWSSTPLSDMKKWPDQLRLAVNLVMSDPSPAVIYWGQELTTIYNEAYISTFKAKHPWALGRPFCEVYSDIAIEFKDFHDSVWEQGRERGRATSADEQRFVMVMDSKCPEETFFSYTVLPVLGPMASVGGFYATFKDVTRTVLATRRASTLRAVIDANANGMDPELFWRKLVDALSFNESDVVSVLAYSVRGMRRHEASITTANSAKTTVLEAFSTVPMDDRGVPRAHNLLEKNVDLAAIIDEVLRTGLTRTYNLNDLILAESFVRPGLQLSNKTIPKQLAFCSTDPHLSSQGILAIALNPLRPYDTDYQHFLENMAREISSALAAFDRARFAAQAILESESRFSQMTATSPAAHFEINLEGQLLYVNDRWHSITGMPRPGHEIPAMSWLQLIHEPDLPVTEVEWGKLQEGKSVSFEVRMKKEWQAINPFSGETLNLEYTWVLAMASQHTTKNGPTIMGCLVDINRQKWAEDFHKRKTQEAIELKHQQERFIDMTSHEMRNPLSAIFQCADSIVSLLEDSVERMADGLGTDRAGGVTSSEPLKNCIEAAQTILLCAQHQKRIVDDVLVFSKMDANMIEITPVDSNPKRLLESGLSIFASELRANDTRMEFRVDESYEQLRVDRVRLDPSRLLQILINLTTNALKFTISEMKERRIVVSLGASTMPSSYLASDDVGFTYLPRSMDNVDPTMGPEWGSGDPIYLHFSVQDTGRGINEAEMKQLFMRFQQASPRTHVEYGGSGLGLHIARKLTEMQGGQIGVSSERGKGSTFSFYIKARRCNPADISQPAPQAAALSFPEESGSPNVLIPAAQQSRSLHRLRESASVHGLQKLNILIVEDNVVNQKVLRKQLQSLGWNVWVANHGLEALEALKQTIFWSLPGLSDGRQRLDLVLMDIEMPTMDGLTTTKVIRKLQDDGKIKGHVPIIAVSANARAEQIASATAAGMVRLHNLFFVMKQILIRTRMMLSPSHSAYLNLSLRLNSSLRVEELIEEKTHIVHLDDTRLRGWTASLVTKLGPTAANQILNPPLTG